MYFSHMLPFRMEISVQKWAEKWNRHHTKMRYLTEFERKVQLYDSLIIETGGRCAQGKCDGNKYEQKCLDDARNYILAGGSKKHLIEMIDQYILFYEKETEWKYQDLEMTFLRNIKEKLIGAAKMNKKEIRAVYSEKTIRVYQAYCDDIADEAIGLGTFGKKFKMDRMTWIKPSFLWMMYRCGWATKSGQERVLAIDIKREGFDYIVQHAIVSTYNENMGMSLTEWKEQVQKSDIRCQWDPERDIYGNPLQIRSIQLGLRREAVKSYVNEWIIHIEDITAYVKDLYNKKNAGIDIHPLLPKEQIYTCKQI